MDITTARNEIDRIDEQITALFCQRMACSAAIGAYKAENALPIYVPSREEEILEKLTDRVPTEYKNSIRKLYLNIFAISREYQQYLAGNNDT